MSDNQKGQITGMRGFSPGLPDSLQIAVWILISLVIMVSLLDLAGWSFDIDLLKSLAPQWVSMKKVTAICFILAAASFILNRVKFSSGNKGILPAIIAIIICLVSLLSLYVDFYQINTGGESFITKVNWLAFVFSPGARMARLTALNFLLMGSALLLLTKKTQKADGMAHTLIIPVALISYFIPVSYIIGVYSANDVHIVPIALHSGLTFFFLCIAMFLAKPGSWVMKVFISRETGSIFIRKLLPALIALPVIIGWLRIYGERKELFASDVGVALVVITYTTSFLLFAWLTARSVNHIDKKRFEADEALKRAYAELDHRVKERTAELLHLNKALDAEIVERSKTQEILIAQQKRFNDLVELLPAYLILLTPDYHVSYANRFFRERFGENRLMQRCYEYLFNRTEACDICETFKTLKEDKPQTWEWTGPDGRCYSIFDFPFTDTDGSPLIMEVGIDITDLKNAEAKLRNINAELEERVEERTEELMMSEKRYNVLFENMNESFALNEIIVDDDGIPCDYRFLAVNPAFERQTGFKAENVIGKTAREIYPAVNNFWIYTYGKVALTGESADFENFSTSLNKHVRVSAFCPKIGYFAIIFEDITSRILAEKELKNTKNYLENLINYANAPIIVWNPASEIMLFNYAFEHLTGYKADEVLGKKIDMLFPRNSLKESTEKIKDALTKNWETIEIPILTKEKKIRTILWNSANIYDTDGNGILAIIAQGNDITERIRAEKEVIESKSKLELALENAKVGTWEWDIKTGRFEWDQRMGKMFGFNSDKKSRKYEYFEKFILEEDVPHFKKAIKKAIEKDIPLDTVIRIKGGNENYSHISIKALLSRDKTEKSVKMTGVCFDITGMKKSTERAIFLLNEDLLRSNRELEQFAYVASHDLQEPLRMVSSFTQLLAMRYKDKLDAQAQEFINFAVDGASRMQTLINDLLEYSRIETRGKTLLLTDMHVILGQVLKNLGVVIAEKNALVTNDELPAIYTDGGQMVQLLQNLIGNALKFCDTSPRIHISANEEQDQFLFSVKDNGIGIESQYFEKIFQIFQRLHSRDEFSGTGIGLAICRRIVERHGGKIWVESKPGEGATFKFTIKKR